MPLIFKVLKLMNAISEEYLNELKEAFSLFEDKVKTPNGGLIKTT